MALLTRIGAATLLLWGLEAAPAVAQEDRVGEIVQSAPTVKGRRGDGPQSELKKRDPVFVGMEIETLARAGARIVINRNLRRGVVILGPKTTVEFSERLVKETLGLKEISWLVKFGQFQLALFPPPPGSPLEGGEYKIITPNGTEIRLQGTDVAVQVDRNGTVTVWVIEGAAAVTAADHRSDPVQVPAGFRTRVLPGRTPETPVPFGSADGPGPSLSPPPGEEIFSDPPSLNLRDFPRLQGGLSF